MSSICLTGCDARSVTNSFDVISDTIGPFIKYETTGELVTTAQWQWQQIVGSNLEGRKPTHRMLFDKNDNFYVTTNSYYTRGGIFRYNIKTGSWKKIVDSDKNDTEISLDFIDWHNNVYFSKDKSIYKYSPTDNSYTLIYKYDENDLTVSAHGIYDYIVSTNGDLFTSDKNDNILRLKAGENKFQILEGSNQMKLRTIFPGKNGNVYFWNSLGGFFKLSPESSNIENIIKPDEIIMIGSDFYPMQTDPKGNLYFSGRYNTLFRFNIETEKFEQPIHFKLSKIKINRLRNYDEDNLDMLQYKVTDKGVFALAIYSKQGTSPELIVQYNEKENKWKVIGDFTSSDFLSVSPKGDVFKTNDYSSEIVKLNVK